MDSIVNLAEKVERMAHDFCQAQSVRCARACFLCRVLHDWLDEKCVGIVHNTKDSMTPCYSRLRIKEHIISPHDANWEAIYLNLYKTILYGSRERTEAWWRDIP
jgi:hypothetical protein